MKPYPDETMATMDEEMLKFHQESNILAMPYFSLCSGFFTKLAAGIDVTNSPYYTEENIKLVEHLQMLTLKYKASLTQIIMGFFLVHDMPMCALAGAGREDQLIDFMGTLNKQFNTKDFQ